MPWNLINFADWRDLWYLILKKTAGPFFKLFFKQRDERTKSFWQNRTGQKIQALNLSAVFKQMYELQLADNSKADFFPFFKENVIRKYNVRKILSLGSGNGSFELQLAEELSEISIDGYDFALKRVEFARQLCQQKNLVSRVNFFCADIFKTDFPKNHYDLILARAILHHIKKLHILMQKLKETLKADGLLFCDEFVGPRRFQWSKNQLKLANALLVVAPEKYRLDQSRLMIKKKIVAPSRLRMWLLDPSEAVSSDRIIPLLNSYFQPILLQERGGSLSQLIFYQIAGNFKEDDPLAQEYIRIVLEVEKLALKSGYLENNYIFGLWQNKHKKNPQTRNFSEKQN